MPKYFEHTTTFNFTWDQVAQAFWQRYPNPNSTHVLSEDTVSREIRSGKLFSKRLLSKTNSSVPKWAEKFVPGGKVVCIVEESIVDPKTKVLVTYTRNLGHTKIMSITERVEYRESDVSPGCTVAVRSAWIESQVKGFSRAICAFGMDRFRKNCNKMVGGFNYVLASMFPPQGAPIVHTTAFSATSKLKDAAKNASELAKAKAVPIYASLHPNQS